MYKRLENIKNEKMFKWWDIAVGIVVLASIVASFFMYYMPQGKYVEIYVNSELKYRLPIDVDKVITVDDYGHNVIVIKNGEVYMAEANCPDKKCMHERHISKAGDQIVCLPNKVVVLITGKNEGSEIDATT